MASKPSVGTEDGEEKRIAWDGRPYTRLEFMDYYGNDWNTRWGEASIAPAGGAPQPAAAAGAPVGGISLPSTPGQQPPQAQAAPTIAGAS